MALLAAALILAACASGRGGGGKMKPEPAKNAAPEPIASLLARPELAGVLREAEEHRVQIVFGTIEDGPDGRPVLRQVSWRAGAEYFYPASSVKLFAAVAALEYLHELRKETGIPLGVDTPLAYYLLFGGEKARRHRPHEPRRRPHHGAPRAAQAFPGFRQRSLQQTLRAGRPGSASPPP